MTSRLTSIIPVLLMTYSYAQRHDTNYNIAKTKLNVVDNSQINESNVLTENFEGNTVQTQGKEPGDKTNNHGRLGRIRQTPGYRHIQKQPFYLPEETGVQHLCAASYDI